MFIASAYVIRSNIVHCEINTRQRLEKCKFRLSYSQLNFRNCMLDPTLVIDTYNGYLMTLELPFIPAILSIALTKTFNTFFSKQKRQI
jgi:hypothetical protein